MRLERVTFLPRHTIEQTQGLADAGLLTFHDPQSPPHRALPGWAAHASFAFHDTDAAAEGKVVLTPEMASDIFDFVDRGVGTWRELFVSCELGVSRSGAAALLFAEAYGAQCYASFAPVNALSYRVYNRHVYRRLYDAVYGRIGSAFLAVPLPA